MAGIFGMPKCSKNNYLLIFKINTIEVILLDTHTHKMASLRTVRPFKSIAQTTAFSFVYCCQANKSNSVATLFWFTTFNNNFRPIFFFFFVFFLCLCEHLFCDTLKTISVLRAKKREKRLPFYWIEWERKRTSTSAKSMNEVDRDQKNFIIFF